MTNREVIKGETQTFIRSRISGTNWELFVFPSEALVDSKMESLVQLEEWDVRTPDEFIRHFTDKLRVKLEEDSAV